VIEAQRASILAPRDHRHINHERTCDARRQDPGNLSGVTTDLVFCLL